MDLIIGLPRTNYKHNAIWVIIDKLTRSVHVLAMKTTDPLSRLAKLYIWEIVHLYSIPLSIVSNQDSWFTFRF